MIPLGARWWGVRYLVGRAVIPELSRGCGFDSHPSLKVFFFFFISRSISELACIQVSYVYIDSDVYSMARIGSMSVECLLLLFAI